MSLFPVSIVCLPQVDVIGVVISVGLYQIVNQVLYFRDRLVHWCYHGIRVVSLHLTVVVTENNLLLNSERDSSSLPL